MSITLPSHSHGHWRAWINALVALCMVSCGGGGGGSPAATGVSTIGSDAASSGVLQQGRFIDSPVIGVAYKTATQSGFTGNNGEFAYRTGESVTFSICKLVFPTVPASAQATPLTNPGEIKHPTVQLGNHLEGQTNLFLDLRYRLSLHVRCMGRCHVGIGEGISCSPF